MIARVLAVIVAVGMVAGALVYRNSKNTDGAPGAAVGGQTVCAAELGVVCDAVPGAVVEPVQTTVDRLSQARTAADADIRAWLVPGPWAAMIDDARELQSKPALFARPERLAHTDLVAIQKTPGACPAPVTWKCLGDAAQPPNAAVGADAKASPTGLFIRAAALSGFFGQTGFATNDLDDNPDARGWLANLERAVGAASSKGAQDIQRFLISAPDVRAFLTTAQAAGRPEGLSVPSPEAHVTVELVRVSGAGRGGPDAGRIRDALASAGWKAGPPTGGDGLPSPGVLLALREVL